MISSEVGKKYASALFKLTKKEKLTDPVLEEFRSISRILRENPTFKNFLEAPQILEKDKKDFLKGLFEGKISEVLLSFLTLLVDRKRIKYLLDIFPEYERLVKEEKGILLAEVTTAIPLKEAFYQRLKEKLERKTQKKIEMIKRVDPDIIGGVVVVLGDKVIDHSIRYQLGELKERVSEVRVH
jgi:F-type H+-transporting ATPase subunit delta